MRRSGVNLPFHFYLIFLDNTNSVHAYFDVALKCRMCYVYCHFAFDEPQHMRRNGVECGVSFHVHVPENNLLCRYAEYAEVS
jgi:hypothetical protein